jgi:hypothetical protein
MELAKEFLYRFPWSLNDNPIGWLEVTDLCNLHCRGCYRLTLNKHKPFAVVQEEVRFLKRWRNCDSISIAGGEPLIYPKIVETVAFIREQGLKPFVLSNGIKATTETLRELRRAGLIGIGFHVDMFQGRPHWEGKNEIDLCELRQEYVEMVADVGNLPCGFGMTVYRGNFPYIPDLVRWVLKNRGKVQSATFITYRSSPGDDAHYEVAGTPVDLPVNSLGYVGVEPAEEIGISSPDVYRLLHEHFPAYAPAAYLGGTQRHDSFKWLIGYLICSDDQILGSVGPKTVEFTQAVHHLLWGTYFAYLRGTSPGRKLWLTAFFDRRVRRALRTALRRPTSFLFRAPYGVSIGIIQAPDVLPGGRVDMCESCPDMTVWDGQLVHSCRLDEHRKFGHYVTPVLKEKADVSASGGD